MLFSQKIEHKITEVSISLKNYFSWKLGLVQACFSQVILWIYEYALLQI